MRNAVDLPDPVAARFVRSCQQNGWKLSAAKRRRGGLEKLSDDEIAALEAAVREAFEGISSHELE